MPEPRGMRLPLTEPPASALALIALALAVPRTFSGAAAVVVFVEAFREGARVYFAALSEPEALAAIRLTVLTAAICVPLNTAFGLAAAWSITKFQFRGKSLLLTLIDLPFSVSPVVAGPRFRAALRIAGPASAPGWRRTASRSSSRCPASSSRRCS